MTPSPLPVASDALPVLTAAAWSCVRPSKPTWKRG